jgi:hypothetical protein
MSAVLVVVGLIFDGVDIEISSPGQEKPQSTAATTALMPAL